MASYFKRTRKRKDGSTYTKWIGEYNYNGKTKTVSGKTKAECQEKIREWTTDKITYGVELDKTSYTVSDLLHKHLFTNIYSNVADSTFDRYMCLYNKHIKDSNFGNTLITDIRQMNIQEWFNSKKDVSPSGLGMLRYLLRQSFDWAIINNYIRINPVTSIKLPKREKCTKRKIQILSEAEQVKYLEALNHTKYKILFLTALFTGMRRGELLALRWENVDLKNKTITVTESLKRLKKYEDDGSSENVLVIKEPKTENAYRTIPIPESLNKLLIEHKLNQDHSINKGNHVFINSYGATLQPEYLRLMQISICKRADIPYKNFHSLRHTYATRLIESETDVKTVSKLLGHSDVTITLNTYVHDTEDSRRNAALSLEERFKDFI